MAMAFESSHSFAGHALPTPSDTPYEGPTFGASQRSSHYGNSSSPPQFIPDESSYLPRLRADREATKAEKRSSLDPRRFTLDLDNSLVQQIHALQLQLESKTSAINGLEESLHQSKIEASRLSEENRLHQLKTKQSQKQWKIFETEMIGAMENMVNDRDSAVEEKMNLLKRADEYKKRLRSQEEEAERARSIREKEEEAWSKEKGRLQLRLHKSEAQLENMLAGIAAVQSPDFVLNGNDKVEEDDREKTTGRPESSASFSRHRADSRTSVRSSGEYSDYKDFHRRVPSSLSALHETTESKTSSLSLAEELDGEDTEQEEDHPILNSRPMSPTALPEGSEMRHRYSEDHKARRRMGLRSEHEEWPGTQDAAGRTTNGEALDYLHASRIFNATYTDTATQCTPPSSPTLAPQSSPSTASQKSEQTEQPANTANTTNQRRKRVSIPSLFMGQSSKAKADPPKSAVKTTSASTGCQTDEWEPSTAIDPALRGPPAPVADVGIQTLIGAVAAMTESVRVDVCDATSQTLEESSVGGSLLALAPSMTDADTQTSEERIATAAGASTRLVPDTSADVPLIAIHPPASRPPSSHTSVVLPPRTKNAACQAVVDNPRQSRSISVQTDPLRFSKSLARMPPRAASSQTVTHLSRIGERQRRTTASQPPDIQRRHMRSPPPIRNDDPPPASPPISSIRDLYPGSNDDGPLDGKSKFGPRRPIRSNSIFAGFSDEKDDIGDIAADDFTDDEFADAPPIRKTLSKVKNSWKLVPQPQPIRGDATSSAEANASLSVAQNEQPTKTTSKTFNVRGSDQATAGASSAKSAAERPGKMVASNSAPMISRQRSPSAPNVSNQTVIPLAPPIPVPTRASSRKLPISKSDGAGSPTPYSTSFFTSRRAAHQGRPVPKRKAVRKTQSAAAVTLPEPRSIPAAPVPTATSSNPPSTPRSLSTRNQFSIPFPTESEQRRYHAEVSRPVSANGSALIETQNQQTSVVDAIAQTMVGEWMWKYVRKRTSFGISENPQAEFESGKSGDSGGARHKRWVWLAPYERAVIWSGKQPTSGPALLGKGGRKLAIQSVLDVKDDKPLPKGAAHEAVFDRSILILTPERALKFTATSKERHYIWLTALSFLSASTQGMTGLDERTPFPEQQEAKYPRPPSREPVVGLRRGPIRDSIRISKSKSRPSMGSHSFSSPPTDLGFTPVPTMSFEDAGRPSEEAAEPPQVPRIAAHARKRSSTGPRAIPLSALQNYPHGPIGVGSSIELNAPTVRERYEKNRPWSRRSAGPATAPTSMMQRTTESNVIPNDYFDAVGTVRMEAFVDNKEIRREERKRDREARSQKAKQGRKKDMAYWGVAGSSAGRDSASGRSEDPFRGF